jgi:SAM-dependent methyltransferase
MSFEDNTFDLFITQDVLEHVFHPEKALKEIMRVLKPGGAHVFTAPKHRGLGPSYARALLINDNIQYLAEVEYHGNPVGDGRALVTWDFGDDFEELVSNWTSSPVLVYLMRDRQLGIDGEYIEVFVIKKSIF